MAKRPSYRALIERNLYGDPDWSAYARDEIAIPDREASASVVATFFFYLGDHERGREVSAAYSTYAKARYERH